MENVFFEYPTADAREEILALYNAEKKAKMLKMRKKTITLVIVFLALIGCAFISQIISMVGIIALFALMLSVRRTPRSTTLTEIYATYNFMNITVHAVMSDTKKYSIPYDAIRAATIDDKYSVVTLAVDANACTVENLTHKSEAKNTNTLLSFTLESYSVEQGFFVFYAPQVIRNYNIDRVDAARVFGDEEKYFSQI